MSPTAVHEAGHALVAHVVGFTDPGAVTVNGHGHARGMAITGTAPDDDAEVICLLAGHIAVALLATPDAPERGQPPADAADLAALPEHERGELAAALLASDGPGDLWGEDTVSALMLVSGGIDSTLEETSRRLDALRDRAVELITTHAAAVRALAVELDERGTMSVRDWRAVLTTAGAASPAPA